VTLGDQIDGLTIESEVGKPDESKHKSASIGAKSELSATEYL